jgi:serine phosphatase RsbU (regulator of sigma subunit)
MFKKALFFLLFISIKLAAQETSVLIVDSDASNGIELNAYWKFHEGDDFLWATTDFDDNAWDELNTSDLDSADFKGIGWFRLHLYFDTSVAAIPYALGVLQASASEIYINGNLIANFGMVSTNIDKEQRYYPNLIPVSFNFIPNTEYVIAIRYSNHKSGYNRNINLGKGFRMFLLPANPQILNTINEAVKADVISIFPFGFIIALGIAHLFIFLFYRANKNNVYFFLFASLLSLYALTPFFQTNIKTATLFDLFDNISMEIIPILLVSLLLLIYAIFYHQLPKVFWYMSGAAFINFLFVLLEWRYNDYVSYFFIVLTLIEVLRIVVIALVKKKEGSLIIGIGVGVFILFVATISLLPNDGNFSDYMPQLRFCAAVLSIPVSMSLYLAKQFAATNKSLQKKLSEVKVLSEKNIEQEKEKQKILASQNELLETQVKERTSEISEQKKVIEEKNKDITDSINYAKTIQDAILPSKELKDKIFSNAFILFKPKDIVSGDFYWFAEKNEKKLIAACDCTGHGVPGALMSMVGNNILNQIVNEKGIISPDAVLNQLHKEMRQTLKQEKQEETKDGMDIALITFKNETEIEYAGAYRPLWIISQSEPESIHYKLTEIKPNKFSIGGYQDGNEPDFAKHSISLQKNDTIYIFSDGFADQFNQSDEKLMTKRFKEVLLEIQQKSMDEQEQFLASFIDNWRGGNTQIDDILVIGIRI